MPAPLTDLVFAVEESGPVSPPNANWGQLALVLVASGVLIWLVYLFIASRRVTTPAPSAENTTRFSPPRMPPEES